MTDGSSEAFPSLVEPGGDGRSKNHAAPARAQAGRGASKWAVCQSSPRTGSAKRFSAATGRRIAERPVSGSPARPTYGELVRIRL